MKRFTLIVLILFLFSCIFASTDKGKELFELKCSKCHPIERALSKTKSLSVWKITLRRMAKYSEEAGGSITSEETTMIAEYLAER